MASSIQIPVTQTGLEASIQAAARKAGQNLQINLGANAKSISSLSQPLGKITGQANEFTKSMEAANARVFAFGASVGIVNMVAKSFSSLVKNTIAVESSLTEINVVLGKSSKELDKFGNKLFDLAKSTGQTFDTVAQGALELSRQGLSATETVKRLNDALILSRLSGLDAAQSVEGLTAAINSYTEAGISSEKILNKLVNVSQKYAVSEKDLIEGIKRSASVANQAGVSFDELLGIITTVQERTARGGAVIGNAFKTIFSKIQDKGALQDLQDLGVQVTDLSGQILPATSILENLAKQFDSFSKIEQADITKKLGGVYQLSNLLAAVKDLSKEQSNYSDIVQIAATASNEAYQKNIALNTTLASVINKVNLSGQELGATLGRIGITDSAKNLLNFFNSILQGIQNILGEESAMGDFVKGLVKGIGNLVSGPGLALFGAIIAKLSKDLVQFGFSSLKSFFKIGDAAKEISNVQSVIANTLLTNKNIQSQILAIENSALSVEEKRAAQTKFFTQALNTQLAVMNQMKGLAVSIAPAVYSGTGGRGARNAAGGYMPALAKESADIKSGVGGAKTGDRPVVIPNFAFGGGQRGSMVAHTGEYIVPNFANGGSAIFNRNMVQSMGLPAGAKKIGAAGGFVPNFSSFNQRDYESYFSKFKSSTKTTDLETYASGGGRNKSPEYIRAAKDALNAKTTRLSNIWNAESAPSSVMLLPNASVGQNLTHTFKAPYKNYNQFIGRAYGINPNLSKDSKFKKMLKLDSAMDESLASAANFVLQQVKPDIDPQPDSVSSSNIKNLISAAGGAGALGSIRGALFEAVTNSIVKGISQESVEPANNNTLDVSFGRSKKRNVLEEIFGLPNNRYDYGDYKNSLEQKDKYVRQVIDNLAYLKNSKAKRSSEGYIPNFANPLKQAVNREMAAGVPSSQIYIDKNSSLKNAANPMGLMVANRRDEPNGGYQGINRAIKEGRNPQTYGAAAGFVPNYADLTPSNIGTSSRAILQNLDALNAKIAELNKSIQKNKISYDDAEKELNQFIDSIDRTTQKTKTRVSSVATAQLQQSGPQQSKDMLGTIFAVQGLLSVLSGFTQDLEGTSGIVIKGLNDVASSATTAAFAVSGIKQIGGKIGKFASVMGPWGIAAAGLFESFKMGAKIYNEQLGVSKIANQSLSKMSDAAEMAAVNLGSMSKANQFIVKENAKKLFEGAAANKSLLFGDLFEGFGDELPNALFSAVTQASAAGVYDEYIKKLITDARDNQKRSGLAPFTVEETKDLIIKLSELTEATKGAKSAFENFDFSNNKELRDALLVSDEQFQANLNLPENQVGLSTTDPYYQLRDLASRQGVSNTIAGNELITALRQQELNKDAVKKSEDKNRLDQINLDLVKQSLKNTLEISKAMDRQFNSLDKRILSAKIIGNLSQKELRDLEYIEQQREIERETADQTLSILSEQLDKIKGITGSTDAYLAVNQQLKSLSTADLNEKYKILGVLQQINSISIDSGEISEKELSSLRDKIETMLEVKQLSEEDLKNKKNATEEAYKQKTLLQTGLTIAFNKMKEETDNFSFALGEKIPQLFSDNMSQAISEMIDGTKSFEESFKGSIYNIAKEINSSIIKQFVNKAILGSTSVFGSIFQTRASGGPIVGGSGTKDDVPAMLMGGEFVINKKAAQKYGPNFLNALNNGSISGYAKGGSVQKGPQGNFYTPGQYGYGEIKGSSNLLAFASQAYTSGVNDKIVNQGSSASIALEAESSRLTNFGRRTGPAATALRSAKEEALSLYLQDYRRTKDLKEQQKEQEKAEKKAFRNQLLMMGISLIGGAAIKAGATGFKNAYAASANTGGARIFDATKGIWSGGDIGEGIMGGGLKNLFSGNFGLSSQTSIPKASIVDEASQAPRAMSTIDQIGGSNQIKKFRATAYGLASIDPTTAEDQRKADAGVKGYEGFSQTVGASGRRLRENYSVASNYFPLGAILNINGQEFRVDDRGGMTNNIIDFFAGENKELYNNFAGMGSLNVKKVRATGGSIPSTSGIDTIPTMLSGGEFIMNRAAAQNIGAGNLQALNSGATSLPTEEKSEELNDRLIAKLDELIDASGSAGNITINIDGSGKSNQSSDGQTPESKQQLARQVKDAVLKVIQEEKRLGGQLRRGM